MGCGRRLRQAGSFLFLVLSCTALLWLAPPPNADAQFLSQGEPSSGQLSGDRVKDRMGPAIRSDSVGNNSVALPPSPNMALLSSIQSPARAARCRANASASRALAAIECS